MRKLSSFLASSSLALLLIAAPSFSAVLPVSGTLQLQIATLPPPTLTGSAAAANSVGGGVASVPAGMFAGPATQVLLPISPSFVGLAAVSVPANSLNNPAGSFNPNGAMGLSGSAFFLTAGNAAAGQVALFPIGGGGNQALNIGPLAGTVIGATWMGGTQVFTAMLAALAIPLSAQATSYDNRDAGGVGTVQLVAPAKAALGIFGNLPVYGILTLTYTPEPGTLLLLGTGIAGLAMIGRKKMSK